MLKLCYRHCQHCLTQGQVVELERFTNDTVQVAVPINNYSCQNLDAQFNRYRDEADLSCLLDDKLGDVKLAPLLQTACRALAYENPPHGNIDAVVDTQFGEDLAKCSLHARLRLCYNDEGDREEHSVCAIQHKHASAFQARLKAAITQAGIDRRLKFRRLSIIRTTEQPGGPVTKQLVTSFLNNGGLFLYPTNDELRTLWAVWRLQEDGIADLAAWLHQRRPVSQLDLMQHAVPALCSKPQVAATAPLAPAKKNEDVAPTGSPRPLAQENPAHKDNCEIPAVQQPIELASTIQERQQPKHEQELPPKTPLPLAAPKQPCRHVVFGRQLIGKTEGARFMSLLGDCRGTA